MTRLAGGLHAEQAILLELANVLRNPNKVNPSHVRVAGAVAEGSSSRRGCDML